MSIILKNTNFKANIYNTSIKEVDTTYLIEVFVHTSNCNTLTYAVCELHFKITYFY